MLSELPVEEMKKKKKNSSKVSMTCSYKIKIIPYPNENHRDEERCRRWDALEDEDHTHHLTTQEYSFYKSKWWLRSNKTGADTLAIEAKT